MGKQKNRKHKRKQRTEDVPGATGEGPPRFGLAQPSPPRVVVFSTGQSRQLGGEPWARRRHRDAGHLLDPSRPSPCATPPPQLPRTPCLLWTPSSSPPRHFRASPRTRSRRAA